ncbi:hypothetical protein EDD86DRAFT_273342 [Gorgonomyces haynaldii]|nr:hypothetical protein EDD86DRAFT_273342 [Gorgonomyces haynaldii]
MPVEKEETRQQLPSIYPTFIMSQKYKRSLNKTRKPKHVQHIHADEPPSEEKRKLSTQKIEVEQKQEQTAPKPQRNRSESALLTKTDDKHAHDDITYSPFQLGEHSSYNSAKVTQSAFAKMDPYTKAKYKAYDKIEQTLMDRVIESERRSRQILRQERKRNEEIIQAAKIRWTLLHSSVPASQTGQQGAKEAKKRIQKKLRLIEKTREDELQFLVEGQANSIDAIRLKEHLVLGRVKAPSHGLSDTERLRLEELLER